MKTQNDTKIFDPFAKNSAKKESNQSIKMNKTKSKEMKNGEIDDEETGMSGKFDEFARDDSKFEWSSRAKILKESLD